MPNVFLEAATGWDQLTNLKIINFANNKLTGNIPALNLLCNLEILDLSSN